MSYTGLFLPLGVLASVAAWNLARHKGLNERRWAVVCFLFFPALLVLAFTKGQHRIGDTPAFRERWVTLAAYDPEIRAAVERLSALGPAAVEQFRRAYADVQARESVPLIVADLEARWAAGDRFDGTYARAQQLADLHRGGQLSDREYAAQTKRLRAKPQQRLWAGWWWKLPLLLAVIWLVWPTQRGSFPTCDASASRELVRQAIENADDSRYVTRRLLTLDQVRELSYDAGSSNRYCSGMAVLNAGERQIVWRLYARGDSIVANVSGF